MVSFLGESGHVHIFVDFGSDLFVPADGVITFSRHEHEGTVGVGGGVVGVVDASGMEPEGHDGPADGLDDPFPEAVGFEPLAKSVIPSRDTVVKTELDPVKEAEPAPSTKASSKKRKAKPEIQRIVELPKVEPKKDKFTKGGRSTEIAEDFE